MSIVSRNRPPFGEEGQAIVYAGEAVTVGFRLQQPDGSGGYEVQTYTGREFALRIYSDGGTTVVNVNGSETSHADGAYIACSLAAADTTSLTPSLRGWEFVEYTETGRVVICAGQFEIALGAGAAQSEGSPGSGSSGITLYTLRTDTNIVTVNYMGAAGADGVSPWGTPAAWVTGTAYAATSPRSVVTNGGSSYVCLVSHTAGTFATDLAAAKWLVIASGGAGSAAWGGITGTLSAQTDLQAALDAKQASDGDLTTFAGLSPSNDDLLQRKAGAWANRTPAQVKTDLALVKGDVGLGSVDNTSDANKPVSSATQTALDTKAPLASPNFTGTVGGVTKSMVGLGSVDNTSDLAKPVSTATQTALDLKQAASAILAAISAGTWTGATSITTVGTVTTGVWNAEINPRMSTAASPASPLTPNSDSVDQYSITDLTTALTINADGGSPAAGQKMIFRIKDNGAARALTWTTGSSKSFRPIGVTLPTTTVINKITYVGCIYNATDARWDVVAVVTEA